MVPLTLKKYEVIGMKILLSGQRGVPWNSYSLILLY